MTLLLQYQFSNHASLHYATTILYDRTLYYFCIVFSLGEHPNESAFYFCLCFVMKTYFLQLDSYFADIILFSSFFLVLDNAPEFTKINTFFYSQSHHKGGQKKPETFCSKPVMSKKISDCLLLQFELFFPVRHNFSSSNSI